ncbi:MAG TPA: DNA repair protein RecO [Thermoanaerobaculia bacterium]|nr:DNA repair protein RecO [Thermoanaerobaculia bacterium]
MKRERTEAIILQTLPSRERDKLIVFVTPGHGRMKGWAYGARGLRNRFGASLEPLAKVEIHFVSRENDETVRIESVEMLRSMFPLQQDLRRSIALTYLAELTDTFAQPEEPSDVVYRLLDHACEALTAGAEVPLVVGYAEVWMLRIAGLFPSLRSCLVCNRPLELPLRYESQHGGFVCADCGGTGAQIIPNELSRALQLLLSRPIQELDGSISSDDLFEIRTLAGRLRREFLGHELKSWEILQSVL